MSNKTYIKSLLAGIAVLIVSLNACKKGDSFLDKTDTGTINQQLTFSDSTRTMKFLTGIYQDLPVISFINNGLTGGGLWAFSDATDDSEMRWSGIPAQAAQAYNAANFPGLAAYGGFSAHWNTPYANIRRVNIFLANVDLAPLSAPKKLRMKGEARFLRALYYSHLLRCFGGTPLIGDKQYGLTDDFALPRGSFSACVDYIVSELDAAAALLPSAAILPQEDFGRATQGAALALKARVLLMAASPLYNGQNVGLTAAQKDVVGYPSFNAERWKKAADAAQAVMQLNIYSLVEDNTTQPGYGFYQTFLQRKNSEQIFMVMRGANRELENYLLPTSRAGQTYSFPTQQLVDAFPMANGKPITDPTSQYDFKKPYDKRDPRFYYSILYNGANWLMNTTNKKDPVWLYEFAPQDGLKTNSTSTRTGYLWRKLLNEDAGGNYGTTTLRSIPYIRYAEVLLNFAEATNEYTGPTSDVYNAIETVRRRAGLNPYQLPTGLSKDDMRTYIRNERRIELAYEEPQRFFDVRRWKIAEKTDNGDMYGMRWVKTGNNFTNETFVFETRTFLAPQMYFMPVPQVEINKVSLLIQNPGW